MNMLHLRLRGETIAALKSRARVTGIAPVEYVELVLWYAALEWRHLEGNAANSTAPAEDDELYLAAPLPTRLREHLVARSVEQERNLAAYTGALVEEFLRRFERDPGDLRLVARLSELLERSAIPAEGEFLEVLRLVAGSPVSRMPEAYQARWLHQRLSPFVRQVENNGTPTELTVERMGLLLGQLKAGPD